MIAMSLGWAVFSLVGCDMTASVRGRTVDALTGRPVGGFRVVATSAKDDVALTCKSFDTLVGEDGTFVLGKLCSGGTYRLAPDREELWFAEGDEVNAVDGAAPVELKVWRSPKSDGLYRLDGAGTIEQLTTDADVKRERIRGSAEWVRYPSTIPKTVHRIGPDDFLVLVGKDTIARIDLDPLVPSGTRVFGDETTKVTMDPWYYVGVTFTDDTTYRMGEAAVDTSKVIDRGKGDRVVRYVPGTALPPGRYAALRDDDLRMVLLDFGAGPPPSAVPAATREPAPR